MSHPEVTPLRPTAQSANANEAVPARPDPATRTASGRTNHDAKITVYLTSDELLSLEEARLRLRADFGITVDRGRIVREAVAELLADLRSSGADAAIVRKLGL